MTRGEVAFEMMGAPFTYEWREVNQKDHQRPNVSILRIVASGGGMQCQQDFTEKFLTEDPTASERLRDSLRVMRAWVKEHEAMAAQAAKQNA